MGYEDRGLVHPQQEHPPLAFPPPSMFHWAGYPPASYSPAAYPDSLAHHSAGKADNEKAEVKKKAKNPVAELLSLAAVQLEATVERVKQEGKRRTKDVVDAILTALD